MKLNQTITEKTNDLFYSRKPDIGIYRFLDLLFKSEIIYHYDFIMGVSIFEDKTIKVYLEDFLLVIEVPMALKENSFITKPYKVTIDKGISKVFYSLEYKTFPDIQECFNKTIVLDTVLFKTPDFIYMWNKKKNGTGTLHAAARIEQKIETEEEDKNETINEQVNRKKQTSLKEENEEQSPEMREEELSDSVAFKLVTKMMDVIGLKRLFDTTSVPSKPIETTEENSEEKSGEEPKREDCTLENSWMIADDKITIFKDLTQDEMIKNLKENSDFEHLLFNTNFARIFYSKEKKTLKIEVELESIGMDAFYFTDLVRGLVEF